MITLISFIILLVGAANWMSIGLMQYDFVAGVFGTQSSLLSRIVYIAIGFAAIWIIIMIFKQKGTLRLNDNGFKRMKNKSKRQEPHSNNSHYKNDERRSYNNSHEFSNYHQNNSQHNSEVGEEFYHSNSQRHKNPFD